MQRAIISDTSCLILLDNISRLDVLKNLYGLVYTTTEVAYEYEKPLPDYIRLETPTDKEYQKIIEISVDSGEASAIALALDFEDCLLIIDDLKGRNFALNLGLQITGTLGVLLEAKLSGIISEPMSAIIKEIRSTNFRISDNLENIMLRKAGEL